MVAPVGAEPAAVFAVAGAAVTPARCEGQGWRPAGQQRSSEGHIVIIIILTRGWQHTIG